jgi:predicted nuclease with TOPRIM domain
MVIWPFLAQQQTVNYKLLALIKNLDESLREVAYRLEAQDLDLLSQLEQHNRELSTRVEDLNSRVEELSSCLPEQPTD